MQHFWDHCARVLEQELSPQQFSAWIRPLSVLNYDPDTGHLQIGAPNRLKLEAVRTQFAARIEAAASGVLQRPVHLSFEVDLGDRVGPDGEPGGLHMATPPGSSNGAATDLPAPRQFPLPGLPPMPAHMALGAMRAAEAVALASRGAAHRLTIAVPQPQPALNADSDADAQNNPDGVANAAKAANVAKAVNAMNAMNAANAANGAYSAKSADAANATDWGAPSEGAGDLDHDAAAQFDGVDDFSPSSDADDDFDGADEGELQGRADRHLADQDAPDRDRSDRHPLSTGATDLPDHFEDADDGADDEVDDSTELPSTGATDGSNARGHMTEISRHDQPDAQSHHQPQQQPLVQPQPPAAGFAYGRLQALSQRPIGNSLNPPLRGRTGEALSPEAQAARKEVNDRARLNTLLTFENFVTGKANQLARAAAMQVGENPGGSYNPLFLYGGVGLGKTHLVHAVGNTILTRKPDARVRYIHAEQYVTDVVRAYQRKSFDDFKRYYRSLDLLLIDDIQFFAGKSRTQEEFFYAFEALVSSHKQIIITSDTYPKELNDMDARLVSRFACGLTVSIEPPELEMRVAILLKKAELEGAQLAQDVAFFIAKNLRSNVRELEGALRKVLAFASFHARVVNVDLAREALKDLLSASIGQVTVDLIQKTVAEAYKIKVQDMYSKRRPASIALPRQVAMYLAKEMTQKSLPEIGELFGGRDHTTVLHAVRKITLHRSKDAELNHMVHVLEQTLKG